MTEKLINSKPNGVFALILIELTIVLGIFIFIMGVGSENIFGIIIEPLLIVIAGLAHAGLKVVKPQEALVLTLFGNYTGTIKEPGFYFVNPFSVAVNPANHTRLGQSGDVSTKSPFLGAKSSNDNDVNLEIGKKHISLKVMTLSNSRQKINDCLGNPVEIGIAVTWRVVDTAKAVFNVDNYKEYLSLQCDSALRKILSASILTMCLLMWILRVTGKQMKVVSVALAKLLLTVFVKKSKVVLRMLAWKSLKHVSLT